MFENAISQDEAEKKWCPFARVSGFDNRKEQYKTVHTDNGPSYNRQIIHERDFVDTQDPEELTRKNLMPSTCLCLASKCMAWRWTYYGYGYCGLVVKP